jgi:murein DD-endopeptidase MepM/ murein hydrolase activator NlpD
MTGWRSLTALVTLLGGLALGPALEPPGATPAPGWSWPLRPSPDRVVADFDPPAQPWLAGNRGVDLAGHPGEPVRAAGTGVVSFAGTIAGTGVVSVASGALRTTYEPLRVAVHRGEQVALGAVLGVLTRAGSHCQPAACLHWGLLRGSEYLDPLALLGLERVRLLPLTRATLDPRVVDGARQSFWSASFPRSCRTALVCIWQIRLSVTPRTWPISARVSPS